MGGIPRENPQGQWSQLGINIFPHQFYKKIMLNEAMLFEDLLYSILLTSSL